MKIYLSKSHDCYYNLSLEEALVHKLETHKDVVLFYQNANAVIVGRNQNTYEEVNQEFLDKNQIQLIRRISGGGAVYQDLGNVCFSFMTENTKVDKSYENFLNPIINFLRTLGIDAQFQGRNDLVVDGKKISGNAQFIYKNRIVCHGTLLFDVNFETLTHVLNVSKKKIESKGIKSIRQRVLNLKTLLDPSWTPQKFVAALYDFFKQQGGEEIALTPEILDELEKLRVIKTSWNWNYGKSTEFALTHSAKFAGGILNVRMNVEKGIIKAIRFYGDYLSLRDVAEVEQELIGHRFMRSEILEIFHTIPFADYFGSLQKTEVVNLMFGE